MCRPSSPSTPGASRSSSTRAVALREQTSAAAYWRYRSSSVVGRDLKLSDAEAVELLDLLAGREFAMEEDEAGARRTVRTHVVEEDPRISRCPAPRRSGRLPYRAPPTSWPWPRRESASTCGRTASSTTARPSSPNAPTSCATSTTAARATFTWRRPTCRSSARRRCRPSSSTCTWTCPPRSLPTSRCPASWNSSSTAMTHT